MGRKSRGTGKAGETLLVQHLLDALDAIAPFDLAESWDNVGLQAGHPDREAGLVLVALEVTPEVIAEAKRLGAGTIVAHHPLIFRPAPNMAETEPVNAMCAELIRLGINMIAAHTNLDKVAHGTNGELADRIGLLRREFLFPKKSGTENFKYAVFVPAGHAEAVIGAIAAAGAGAIGNYSHCTFRTPGTGTYKPLEGANPWAGEVGKLEAADEVRLETVCPKDRLDALLQAVRRVHPYEEIAFDVYPLEAAGPPRYGLGLVGELPKPTALGRFAALCKRAFGCKTVGVVGEPSRVLRRAVVCSGSGGDAVRAWKPGLADVLVTGEMTHHQCAEARERGAAVVLLGHFESEVIVCPRLAEMIRTHPLLERFGVQVAVSKAERPPIVRG
ncbi:Nif3-like dinuclear metal center hexameric protein [Candidatus Poribacteria bacterium]|nr:Nif3-like dinuclear metal center hexameric protein [Candidatus Poribacteria bacterium]